MKQKELEEKFHQHVRQINKRKDLYHITSIVLTTVGDFLHLHTGTEGRP